MMNEPVLSNEDEACFARWRILANRHSRTRSHSRMVDSAKRVAEQCLQSSHDTASMWSGGKDSTVMTHLLTELSGGHIELVSEKDDLDYPGEEDYVIRLASEWQAPLTIVRPSTSPSEWIRTNCQHLTSGSDFHSRAAGLSKACFYGVVEEANAGRDAVFLGLRKHESHGRMLNRATHGLLYRKQPTKHNPNGLTVCTPLGDWRGIDVYAYCEAHGIELLHVYRCVSFMHSRDPWRVRKSWWIPGEATWNGGASWLRHYYPSLFQKLINWFPDVQGFS